MLFKIQKNKTIKKDDESQNNKTDIQDNITQNIITGKIHIFFDSHIKGI